MKKKKILCIIVSVLLFLSLAINIMFALNILENNKNTVGSVCGSNIINEFNEAISSNDSSKDVFSDIDKKIVELEGYNNDPNCLLISFYSGLVSGDTGIMKEKYDKLMYLGESGYYPSLDIKYSTNYSDMKENIEMGADKVESAGGR